MKNLFLSLFYHYIDILNLKHLLIMMYFTIKHKWIVLCPLRNYYENVFGVCMKLLQNLRINSVNKDNTQLHVRHCFWGPCSVSRKQLSPIFCYYAVTASPFFKVITCLTEYRYISYIFVLFVLPFYNSIENC